MNEKVLDVWVSIIPLGSLASHTFSAAANIFALFLSTDLSWVIYQTETKDISMDLFSGDDLLTLTSFAISARHDRVVANTTKK